MFPWILLWMPFALDRFASQFTNYSLSLTSIDSEQSRRCPLCSQNIGQYLIHSIRSRYDYSKRYLAPLRISPPPSQNNALMLGMRQRTQRRRQDRVWGMHERGAADESDKLERSISKRRWIYEHNLYAKVRVFIETIEYCVIFRSTSPQTHIPSIGLILRPLNLLLRRTSFPELLRFSVGNSKCGKALMWRSTFCLISVDSKLMKTSSF